jgi:hypothetical protein
MKTKIIYKLLLVVIVFGLVFLFLKGYLYKKEIGNFKEQTICKFVYCKEFPKTSESFFEYYVNGVSYRNSFGKCPEKSDLKLNSFFTLNYSSKDPNKIEVNFSEQVTDTTLILNAGFSKTDIEFK